MMDGSPPTRSRSLRLDSRNSLLMPITSRSSSRDEEVHSVTEDEEDELTEDDEDASFSHNLPACWVSASAAEVAERFPASEPVPMMMLAGAAIPFAFLTVFILWTSLLMYVIFTSAAAECEADGFAHYSHLAPITSLPILASCVCLDFMCWRYIVISKYQVLRRFSILGLGVDVRLWMPAMMVKSSVRFYQFVSVGIFFGIVFKTRLCSRGPQLFEAWDITMQQSFFGRLPYSQYWLPSWSTLLFLALAAVYLKIIYALLHSVPSDPCNVDYEMCLNKERQYITRYTTLVHADDDLQNHGAALMILAEAAGMCLVASDDLQYALAKAAKVYEGQKEGFLKKLLPHTKSQLRRGFQASFLSGVLWNGLLLNLQVTFFAFCYHSNKKGSHQSAFVLGSTAMTSTMQIIDSFTATYSTLVWYTKMTTVLEDYSDSYDDDMRQKLTNYRNWWIALASVTCIYFLEWIYASVKLLMVFHCKDAFWNLGGCVEL